MKKLVEVTEEGLEGLLGERITVFCMNYIYAGKLIGVNGSCILLEDAAVVYETGPFTDEGFNDVQPLPDQWYVQTSAIESFGKLK